MHTVHESLWSHSKGYSWRNFIGPLEKRSFPWNSSVELVLKGGKSGYVFGMSTISAVLTCVCTYPLHFCWEMVPLALHIFFHYKNGLNIRLNHIQFLHRYKGNLTSSTTGELLGGYDALPLILCKPLFLEQQG